MTAPALTIFDALISALVSAAKYNKDDAVAPAAILWPDEGREWEKLVPTLRERLPQLLTLGAYETTARTGPAIWLRCVLVGKIPGIAIPEGVTPIIYLPGVSRATIRVTDECPQELKPLAELQYRGVFWSQQNAKDWTVAAFLQADKGGLGLNLAKDSATAASLRRALKRLVTIPLAELTEKSKQGPLDSDYFDQFVTDDPVDDLLTWLSKPKETQESWNADRWEMLRGKCKTDYDFDCEKDGPIEGGRLLGQRQKSAWKTAWKRFTLGPARYPGISELLRRAKPQTDLFGAEADESWPQDTEAQEASLRKELIALKDQSAGAARKAIDQLEQKHSMRRDWVWAKIGRAPLAMSLAPLQTLADTTANPLAGGTTEDMISAYANGAWKADAAMLDSLAAVSKSEDLEAIGAAIDAIYVPWLREGAELFQQRVKSHPIPDATVDRLGPVASGTCVFFVDGLRYDVGQKLRSLLESRQASVKLRHHTSALPSVTPTAKPAISPVAAKIKGLTPGEDFNPGVAVDGKDLNTDRFRKLLEAEGYQILFGNQTGDPAGIAWTEHSIFDQTGHNEGAGLARRIVEILEGLAVRVEALIAAGWQEVRIVTDHGWLLLPGGLPKAELPKHLTATRWGRSAVVKVTSQVDFPCFNWHWASNVRIACPHGIDCFTAGKEYNHGGLSVQECVVPQLSVHATSASGSTAKIDSVRWSGLRCRIKVSGTVAGCALDLRDKAADPSTSLSGSKPVGKDGTGTLLVENDAREGTATNLVLLDASGGVIEKMPVNVGG
jgi:hypothetical protein